MGTVTDVRANEQAIAKDLSQRRKEEDLGGVDWRPKLYKFAVEQAYFGVADSEIEISTGSGFGDCGFTFQTDQRYLVYAYRYNDKLTTSACTRTKSYSQATEDLAFLSTLLSAAPGVTISGTIHYGPINSAVKSNLSPDVLITIESESGKKEIRPDAEGDYRVTGLPPGKYKLALLLPATLIAQRNEEVITVADRGCGVVAWYISDNGRVNGRVVNADGEPVANIRVSLVDTGTGATEFTGKLERTNNDGYFSLSAVPAGTYHIAVNRNRFSDPNDPTNAYPPSFYPGVTDQKHAQGITVGTGEQLSGFEIRMPPKRSDSILNGTVVWADGTPVVNANLSVKDETYISDGPSYGVKADEQGHFQISGYSGQKLVIEARSNRPYTEVLGPTERSEPLKIKLENLKHTIHIVITKLR